MSRGYSTRHDRRSSPLSAFALLVFGLVTFAVAALAPTQHLVDASLTAMTTGTPLVTGPTIVTSGGLLLISCVSILLGLVLLTLRG